MHNATSVQAFTIPAYQGDRVPTTCNMYREFREVWTCDFWANRL